MGLVLQVGSSFWFDKYKSQFSCSQWLKLHRLVSKDLGPCVNRPLGPLHTMPKLRGEAFGLKKHIKIIHLKPLASHSVKPQRTSPKAKPHTICKNVKSLLGTWMEEFSEIFLSHSLIMDSRRAHIFVLFSVFMVIRYVVVGILAL